MEMEMFSSNLYQLLVLLLISIIAVQLASRGVQDGSFELLIKMNSGRAMQVAPEEKPVAKKSEDVKKRNEQDQSPNQRRHDPTFRVARY
jgi:hypothetical protein